MSKVKLMCLSLLAIIAVSAVASSAASAANCNVKKEKAVFCSGGVELSAATGAGTGSGGKAVLKVSNAKKEILVEIECKEGTLAGTLEAGGVGKGTTTFTGCKVVKPATCKLTAAEEAKLKTEEFTGKLLSTFEDQLVGVGKEEIFIKITLEGGSCALKGTSSVTGSQICQNDGSAKEAETEALEHSLNCKFAGSKLKFGTNTAEFEASAKVKLNSKAKFNTGLN